ncbi:malate dehydrogenase [soil metagenome]
MPLIAIIGAGPIGAALAHKLAGRGRVREIRLIDTEERIAAGKALDIRQSGPIENFATRVTAFGHPASAAGADVVILADHASGAGEHTGEAGLGLLRQIVALGITSPIVFAGCEQRVLMARAIGELHVPQARIVGAAPFALEAALRALAGVALDGSGVEVSLQIVGVPPKQAVVAWEEATAFGQPISSQLPAHEIAALSARIPGLWPQGPYALGSACARVVEAIALGSRRRYSCFVSLGRGRVAALPIELGPDGIRRILEPSLTRQERTMLENALGGD